VQAATTAVADQGLRSALEAGVAALGLELAPAPMAQLLDYVALLEKWNRTYNLTAIREPARMVTHHVLDALAILRELDDPAANAHSAHGGVRVLDVGSGGGVPGIPLAIVRPAWQVTLLDSNRKKTTFLTQAAIELRLSNVDVATARVEAFRPAERYDVIVSRAFAELADFVAGAVPHLRAGGVLAAMKGVHPDEELAALPASAEVVATPRVDVPGLDATRHLILMRPGR
jgi:16S rRNA (guanine527-N7)-methyltransferase